MDPAEKLLTIGQFATLHGINKKTLMWYDEIGLFRPAAVRPENGYRCYSYRQSPVLETILLLRELDVPLPEIQEFMKHRSAGHMKRLLEEKLADLDLQLMHLTAVRKNLSNRLLDMETLLAMDLSEISIVEKEERCLVTVDINSSTTYEQEVELITAQTAKYGLGRLHDASYGSMIPVKSLLSGDFDHYTKLFIEIPFLSQETGPRGQADEGLHIRPAGQYLRAFHRGSWDQIPGRYQDILAWADDHGLTLSGFSCEKGINEDVIDRIGDYIVQIEIPVKEPPIRTQ